MPDPEKPIVAPAGGVVAEVAAAAPVIAPEVAAAPVAEVVVAPAAEVAPAAAVVTEPEKLPTETLTLLEQFDKDSAGDPAKPVVEEPAKPGETEVKAPEVVAEKTAEEKAAEAAKPAETTEVAPPVAPEPIKYDYKLPETVSLPEAERVVLDGALTTFARNPNSAEAQQALMDIHFERLTDSLKAYDRHMHQTFADVRDRWVKQVQTDSQIGGGNFQPAMQAIAYVRDNFVSQSPRGSKQYEADKKAFDDFLHYTGAGDNPSFLRFAHNISVALNEPEMTATTDIKTIPQQDSGGLPPIYRHPTSQRNGR